AGQRGHRGQASGLVVAGAPGQLALVGDAVADVLGQHQPRRAVVELDAAAEHARLEAAAVAALVGPDAVGLGRVRARLDRLAGLPALFLGTDVEDRHRQELVDAVAVRGDRGVVDREEAQGFFVEHPEGQRIALEQCAELGFRARHPRPRLVAVGDVDHGAGETRRPAPFAARQATARGDPAHATVGQHDAVLGQVGRPGVPRAHELGLHAFAVVVVHAAEDLLQRIYRLLRRQAVHHRGVLGEARRPAPFAARQATARGDPAHATVGQHDAVLGQVGRPGVPRAHELGLHAFAVVVVHAAEDLLQRIYRLLRRQAVHHRGVRGDAPVLAIGLDAPDAGARGAL